MPPHRAFPKGRAYVRTREGSDASAPARGAGSAAIRQSSPVRGGEGARKQLNLVPIPHCARHGLATEGAET